jgi:drug/metabolite transporter (DMT)-like permease
MLDRSRQASRRLGRALGMLALVLSVAPIVLLGPSLVHAPITLWEQVIR